jgi:capsular exopolysaccharide synthesis family protein
MARLADALQRASLSRVPREHAPAAAVGADSSTESFLRPRVPERVTPASGAGVLLTMPKEGDAIRDGWRNDPELVGKLVGTEHVSSGALEQYRKLAATLHHTQEERGIQCVMTASSLPSEGKSLTASNLALTLTESYHRKVLLIDADLRRPTVQRLFGLTMLSGLDEGLKSKTDRPMSIVQLSERLFALPAGRPDPDPLSGLTSDRMRRLVQEAKGLFDWIIIDTPPVTLLPDANLLAANVDGVLLVVRAGKTPFQLVKRTVDTIGHERILGVVMNAVDYRHDRNAGGYYEYYGAGYYGVSKKK